MNAGGKAPDYFPEKCAEEGPQSRDFDSMMVTQSELEIYHRQELI
jgi:hypothetical protein